MSTSQYGIAREFTDVSFEDADTRIRAALKEQGFGVLTEIDVQATLKKKIDVDMPRYTILGACNPPLANKGIQAEPSLGLLLPCNVVVREAGDKVMVEVVNASAMFEVVQNPGMEELAAEVTGLLKTALENM